MDPGGAPRVFAHDDRVPEFDWSSTHENAIDWRLGKRVVLKRPKLSLGLGCGTIVFAPVIFVLLVGLALGWSSGSWSPFLSAAFVAAIVLAAICVLFLIPFYRGGGARETVIDWKRRTYTYSYRGRPQVHRLADVRLLRVSAERCSSNTAKSVATLQAEVAGKTFELLQTYERPGTPLEACGKLARVAQRLADSLSIPAQFVVENEFVDAGTALEKSVPLDEVASKYKSLGKLLQGWMSISEHRGKSEAAQWQRDEALFHFMQAHQLDPSLAEPLLEIGRLSGNSDMRAKAAEIASTVAPADPLAKLEQAQRACIDDRLEESLALYTEVIDKAPSVAAYIGRASVYTELGQFESAVADLSSAIELEPDYAWRYAQRADCLVSWHECSPDADLLERALVDYETAMRLEPDDDTWPTHRCGVLHRMGRTDEALEAVTQVIKSHPESFYALKQRAELYLSSGRKPARAVDDLTRALQLMERQPEHADPAMLRTRSESIAFVLQLRAQALRAAGRRAEADEDDARAESLQDEHR